ncbi:class I SAM-dependent methyltransferase [Aquibaculum arenosum]|uniref:Class I SAM-dependent methyltransferase n=1 Tax=Aquibaculum arenosum TaxID=3032591 RepID=A0ABT5YR72_9PROT|nr:class I SAM-dependent methyltransferase [Fodinicurvata sp. CAU 1616]MDF2097418.1 class I SAM-dependent methyltransferase [Fodinicurvata sp. CAU 1616]
MTDKGDIAGHYAREGRLSEKILELARQHRVSPEGPLTVADLATFDQFHLRARQGTAELAELAQPAPGSLVLDIGAGIGGPARQLAESCAVTVVALDLTEAYCRDAATLSAAVGLEQKVLACCADAGRLPFPDATFDLVWTQHAAMNVPDKQALYRDAARVLKPGGRFALHDVMAGPAGPPHYPTPWASRADQSFLMPPERIRELIASSGLTELAWEDRTDALLADERAQAARQSGAERPPGPYMLYAGFLELSRNVRRSLVENRARVVIGLFAKPEA